LLDKSSSIFEIKENNENLWITSEGDFNELEKCLTFIKEEKFANPKSILLNYPAIDYIRKYFKDPIQREIPCIDSQDRIFINPYGVIYGGCLSMGSFGNIKDKNIRTLLRETKYKDAKKNMFFKKCIGCSCGYFFNVRCFVPLIIKDVIEKVRYSFKNKKSRRQ